MAGPQVEEGMAIVAGQMAVGLSAVIGLTTIAGQCAPVFIRYMSGGTLEIVGTGGTQSGTGFTALIPALTVGSGFQVRAGDPALMLNTAGTVYFISSGATAVFSWMQFRSADYS